MAFPLAHQSKLKPRRHQPRMDIRMPIA